MNDLESLVEVFKGKRVKIMYQQINSGAEKTGYIVDSHGGFLLFELLNGNKYYINKNRIVTIEEK